MAYIYNEEEKNLEMFDTRMRDPIMSLFDSILKVSTSYFHFVIQKHGPKYEQVIEHVERVFAYELYRQWADNQYVKERNFVVNAEIAKHFYPTIQNGKIKIRYPDMVLHGGQETSENLLVCEIKRLENIKIHKKAQTKDLNNLGHFLDDDLIVENNIVPWKAYQYGVYILIGGQTELYDKDSCIQIIRSYVYDWKITIPRVKYNKIICIAYNGDCKNIYFTTLNELV
jgi:hypothetical protein